MKRADAALLRKLESSCFVPPRVFLLAKWEIWDTFWIPAFAGMTPLTWPTCRLTGLSTARGEVSHFIRLKGYTGYYGVLNFLSGGGLGQETSFG